MQHGGTHLGRIYLLENAQRVLVTGAHQLYRLLGQMDVGLMAIGVMKNVHFVEASLVG